MFDILFCIRDDHDIRFVGLAAAICLLSTITAVLMIRQARSASARARLGGGGRVRHGLRHLVDAFRRDARL
ncbi:hypothetical protein [Blastomonas sp. CCH5-E3]|uniref:hypothetical protein n=1 Tax=Blastomonas sp. CCH5-E3 TaxID=1768750 RepID=UPI001E588BA1|nr:hypothetical protein [Blastomonas sp. CCH5-E3]